MPVAVIKRGSPAATRIVALPNLVGASRSTAQDALARLGLKINPVFVEADDKEGQVYDQEPKSPKLVTPGATVTLYITEKSPQAQDWAERFDMLDLAIGYVETDDEAKKRYDEVIARLDDIKAYLASKIP